MKKRLVIAFMLNDINEGLNEKVDFECGVNIRKCEQPYAQLKYLNNDETFSINKEVALNREVYTIDIITSDDSHKFVDDEGNEEKIYIYLYNFSIQCLDAEVTYKMTFEFNQLDENNEFFLISKCVGSVEECIDAFNKGFMDEDGNIILKDRQDFCLCFLSGTEEPFSVSITITIVAPEIVGNVEMKDESRNVIYEGVLCEQLFTEYSWNYSFTKSEENPIDSIHLLKIDVSSNKDNQGFDIAIHKYANSDGEVLPILVEGNKFESALNEVGKTLDQLTYEEWCSLLGPFVIGGKAVSPETTNELTGACEYKMLKFADTNTASYYVIVIGDSSDESITSINVTVNVLVGNIRDYEEAEYTLSDDGTYYTFTKLYDADLIEYEVPATYKGLPVKAIGDYAFEYTNISTIRLPDSITELGVGIFHGCSIDNFEAPKGVTSLKAGVFTGTHFSTLIIPETVISIAEYAFNNQSWEIKTGIDNLILRCEASAFWGDITTSDHDFDTYYIKSLTIYSSDVPEWVFIGGVIKPYIQNAIYVKAEYLDELKTKYADTYIVDMLYAMDE